MGYDVVISGTEYTNVGTVKIPISDNESEYAIFVVADDDVVARIADGTITEITNEAMHKIKGTFFTGCKALTSVSFPNVAQIDASVFDGCQSLKNVNLPEFGFANGNRIFAGCTSLESIVLPRITNTSYQMFADDAALTTVDLGSNPYHADGKIDGQCFVKCTALTYLYLRAPFMFALKNVNAFQNLNGKAVNVHVPADLVATYQADSVWSAVTEATLTFVAIE